LADNIKESLSALMDGEASEIEVHRLLRQVEKDAGLKSNWLAYQQIRSVIGKEQRISSQAHLELNHRIKAEIEAEPPYVDKPVREQRLPARILKPVGGLAVAATLVAAIFLGVQTTQLVDSEATPSSQDSIAVAAQTEPESPVPPQLIDSSRKTTLASNNSESFGDESELRELDEEKKKRLRAYLMRHDRLSKMNPYARVSTNKKK